MLLINPYRFAAVRSAVSDADAEAYLQAVEAADGSSLEQSVADAVNDFVVGCKSDGIWSALKASCILAGARTISGALVPLVGEAPTNNNFVSADYSRKTGLKGNGSTKNLLTNRTENSVPQNSNHIAIYMSGLGIGGLLAGTEMQIFRGSGASVMSFRNRQVSYSTAGPIPAVVGFTGNSRNQTTGYIARTNASNTTISAATRTPRIESLRVFSRVSDNYSAARLSFYSIGESLDLAALDTRVSTLMTDLAAAI